MTGVINILSLALFLKFNHFFIQHSIHLFSPRKSKIETIASMVKRKGDDYGSSPSITVVSTPEDPTSSCDITPSDNSSPFSRLSSSPFSPASARTWEGTHTAMDKLLEQFQGPMELENLKIAQECVTLRVKLEEQEKVIRSKADGIKAQIKSHLDVATRACDEEEHSLKKIEEKTLLLQERVSELRDENEEIVAATKESKAKTLQYQIDASRELEQIDEVEALRKREVPKQQQAISLFSTATGIKWDYDCVDSLAGEVEIPIKGIHKRFNIDSDDYSPYEIADMLWKLME